MNAVGHQRASDRVVVIGAGVGGLAAALRLAHAGLDVTVVEAHHGPGGKMRTVPSEAGPVDAGPTVLTLRAVFDDLFAAAGTRLEDHLRLIPQPIVARHWWPDGSCLDLHADPEASALAIRDWAGARAEADFRRFHRLTAQAFAAFDAPLMRAPLPRPGAIAIASAGAPALWPTLLPGMTLARSLARQFRDRRLRQLFGRYATYVGGSPHASPAVLGLIWQAEAQGVWAVQGGMHRLAQTLARLAETGGARLRYGVAAARIETQGGRVSAVVLADGTRLAAGRVVFNGDPAALVAGLLGPQASAAVPAHATAPRSLSACVWSFAARPAALPSGPALIHHNVFFATDPRREFDPIAAGRMPGDPTLYLCAEDRAEGLPPNGPERFEIILNAPPGLPQEPGDDERCRTLTFARLADFGLTFDPLPDLRSLATPAMLGRMFPASQGSIYGLSPHGLTAVFRRPGARTRVPGLYLAGGGAHPGAGVPMAARSGMHAAEAILTDLRSTSPSARGATRGGTSTASRTMAAAPFRSSDS